jgi:hypothetical protein
MNARRPTKISCSFNGSLEIETRDDRLTGIAGVAALRELDDALGLTEWLAENLNDPRDPTRIEHRLIELIRTRTYMMAAGLGAQDYADVLRNDPALNFAISCDRGLRPIDEGFGLASQPTQSRLIDILSSAENREVLHQGLFEQAKRDILAHRGRRYENVTLDIDSTPIVVCGHQEGSAYNAHYRVQCYHPNLVMIHETGHIIGAELRPGNVHTAAGTVDFLMPLIDQTEAHIARVASVRGDAGYPEENLLAALEKRKIGYAFRIKTNAVLEKLAKPYLKSPPGRRPAKPRTWTYELEYQAGSWSRSRRVVLVVQEKPGELFLHHFFLLTNWNATQMPGEDLLAFYRQRANMEGYIGELKSVLSPALSCTTRSKQHYRGKKVQAPASERNAAAANAATFFLYTFAYNLANSARRVLGDRLPGTQGDQPGLRRLRDLFIRCPGRLILSARRATLIIADHARALWTVFFQRVQRLRSRLRSA